MGPYRRQHPSTQVPPRAGRDTCISEIAEATDVKPGSVGPTLVRLRERGRVAHKGTYWRISDHDRSLDAAVGQATAVAASHEDEPFAYDEWQEHAVDPRDQRE